MSRPLRLEFPRALPRHGPWRRTRAHLSRCGRPRGLPWRLARRWSSNAGAARLLTDGQPLPLLLETRAQSRSRMRRLNGPTPSPSTAATPASDTSPGRYKGIRWTNGATRWNSAGTSSSTATAGLVRSPMPRVDRQRAPYYSPYTRRTRRYGHEKRSAGRGSGKDAGTLAAVTGLPSRGPEAGTPVLRDCGLAQREESPTTSTAPSTSVRAAMARASRTREDGVGRPSGGSTGGDPG